MTATASIDPPRGYALDTDWYAERARLDSMTALYDPETLALRPWRTGTEDDPLGTTAI